MKKVIITGKQGTGKTLTMNKILSEYTAGKTAVFSYRKFRKQVPTLYCKLEAIAIEEISPRQLNFIADSIKSLPIDFIATTQFEKRELPFFVFSNFEIIELTEQVN